jgi:alpha-amylase
MLAYPYGYPMVMSSYRFEDDGQGPPDSSPLDDSSGCGHDWVCEHRRPAIANMVAFRKATDGADVVNWRIGDDETISFGRGDIGHVVINVSRQAIQIEVPTSLPTGRYCDVIANGVDAKNCNQNQVSVKASVMTVAMEPLSAVALLAGD